MSEHGITVYFNSSCPVCNADISAQKKRVTGYSVLRRDVHTDVAPRGDINSDLEFIRERLHVIDEEGRKGIGVEAFETIWRHSPGEKWKAQIVSLPGIKQITSWTYNTFTRCLYNWNRRKSRW